jgi:ESCRT-II complex subunit VPS36
MDSFKQVASLSLFGSEEAVKDAAGVTLCEADGSETNFSNGTLTLTSHRILWRDMASIVVLSLDLSVIRSASADPLRNADGLPMIDLHASDSKSSKLLFTNYGSQVFLNFLLDTLKRRKWEIPSRDSKSTSQLTLGHGISAMERKLELESQMTDASLQSAFTGDLGKLMSKAQDMVTLSKKLA